MKKRLWGLLCAACCVLLLTGAVMAEGHEHCVCGAEHANVGDHTAEASTAFTAWTADDALPGEAGSYYLETDVALSTTWYPADGTTLCLNGHTVRLADDDTNTWLVRIDRDVSFALTDCSAQPGSLVLAQPEEEDRYTACVDNNGTFDLYGSLIVGGSWGVSSSGSFTMYDGEISGGKLGIVYNHTDSSFLMLGGKISGGSYVSVMNDGEFTMVDGTISDSGWHGVSNHSTFTMRGGEIRDHARIGVHNEDNANFTMEDGTISGNEGQGVHAWGTVIMKGGTISDNQDGVAIETRGSFTMEGGAITNNDTGVWNGGTFNMKDGSISGGTGTGVFNRAGTFTMNDGTIEDYDYQGVVNDGTFTMNNGTISGGINNAVVNQTAGTFTMKGGTLSGADKHGVGNDGTFLMEGGTVTENGMGVSNLGSFVLTDGTISANTNGGVNNYNGTFTMSGGTISGNGGADVYGGGVNNGGEFTMNGGTITENVAQCGGGVYNTATFTMYDGEISYNTATESGGGVYNTGTFLMDGGTIKRNTVGAVTTLALDDEETAAAVGGGVYNEGFVTMSGGAITENMAKNGGGVYNAETGSLTITVSESGETGETGSAAISGNAAVSGGGVYNEGSVTMTGGEIKDNEATQSGGGVYNNGDVTINDGSVTGNDADESGSGVYNNGSVTMTGGSVTGNGTPAEDPDQPDQPVDPDNPDEPEQPAPSDDIYNNPENENVGFTMSGGEVPEDVTSALIDVTFDPANGEDPYTVQCTGTVSKPEDPVRDGYTFLGWYCGDATWDFAAVVTEATTLTARWQQKQTASVSAPATTYAVRIAETAHGSVTADVRRAEQGDVVTLHVVPAALCRLESLTVTDKSGSAVALREDLTFVTPASDVTVTAVFARIFADVPAGSWYENAVLWAVENNVTTGVGDGSLFAPDAECTRAQVVTLLWRAAGCPAPEAAALPFTDTQDGAWYETAVLWAVENGITKGTGDGTTFSPDETCDRAQIATLLHRFAQLLGRDVSVGEETNILSFDDALTVPDYAFPAMQWACDAGVLQGSGGALLPLKACTRAEIVTMLYRLFR